MKLDAAAARAGPAELDRNSESEASQDPTPIVHLDLSSVSATICLAARETLLVFWLSDWPVGQVYVPGGTVAVEVATLARNAVDSDILAGAEAGLERETNGQHAAALRISVVICTRDRPAGLRRCLSSLLQQTRPPDEIIVVDSASCKPCVRQIVAKAGVRYLRVERPGLDIARNTGVLVATGDIIAFVDDDVVPHRRWLERLVAAFDDREIMAVTGLVLPAELETEAQEHFEKHWGFGRGYRRIEFAGEFFAADKKHGCPVWDIGAGASMAFRSEVFARIGLFDERLDVGAAGCSGDSEFWHRILTAGWRCRYEPAAVAYHYHRRDQADLARQVFAYMRGHACALMVQYERSRNQGNLRRAMVRTPAWLLRRLTRRVVKGATDRDRFLRQEMAGYISGIFFYLTTRRAARSG
jgi:GT2 family glycosyltransferase